LNNQKVDWLDGEKVLVEVCLVIVIAAYSQPCAIEGKKDASDRTLGLGKYHPHGKAAARAQPDRVR
jgi:hypothetical protein